MIKILKDLIEKYKEKTDENVINLDKALMDFIENANSTGLIKDEECQNSLIELINKYSTFYDNCDFFMRPAFPEVKNTAIFTLLEQQPDVRMQIISNLNRYRRDDSYIFVRSMTP